MEGQRGQSNSCILGGTGFIGRHLLKAIEEAPSDQVRILTRDINKSGNLSKNVQIVEGDLLNVDSLNRFLEPGATVINLAFLRNESLDVNIRAVNNLLKACNHVGARRFIHCSSAEVVGRAMDDVITENTSCFPVTEYERTKLEIERNLLENLKDVCEVVIMRPTAVFGAGGENLLKLSKELVDEPRWIRVIKSSLFFRRRMNLVCVENVVEAILFLSQFKENISGKYFIVSDDDAKENNYYDVSGLLAESFGLKPVRTFPLPGQLFILSILLKLLRRSNTNPKRIYSSEKLIKSGFKKGISFQDGITRFASWFKNRESEKNSRFL